MSLEEIQNNLKNLKEIQSDLLDFINNEGNPEYNLESLFSSFNDQKIQDNKYELISLFHLITKIANNHYRGPSFFDKIEKILIFFKSSIKKYFSNCEIFNIFKSNKRILLFSIEEKIITFDEYIVKKITKGKYLIYNYPHFFAPEIKLFEEKEWFPKKFEEYYDFWSCKSTRENTWIDEINKELPEDFYVKRKNGVNDNFVCNLIQNDSIQEFIIYYNKNNFSLNSKIESSIYETNNFLIRNKNITLIEYAAFYGSIQIFQFLSLNNVKLTSLLWLCSIHNNNPEIIHLIEENNIKPESYEQCFNESIKCHNIDVANYFKDNYLFDENTKKSSFNFLIQALKYHNYYFIDCEKIDPIYLFDICKYDYPSIVNIYTQFNEIDVNREILIYFF